MIRNFPPQQLARMGHKSLENVLEALIHSFAICYDLFPSSVLCETLQYVWKAGGSLKLLRRSILNK